MSTAPDESPMPETVLYAGNPDHRADYAEALPRAFAKEGLDLDLVMDVAGADPAEVDYLVFGANGGVTDFSAFTRLRLIQNLWAGVEAALRLPLPEGVPFCRMVEPGLTEGMVDYVLGHVLRHHLDIDRWIGGPPVAVWEVDMPPLARERGVTVLGLGELGGVCARAIARHGFETHGWSRSPKSVEGVTCHHGAEGLEEALARAEILVLLLPQTPETERVINAERLARMPRGACLINAGRGPLIDHGALIAALDAGHIRHATMDVFDEEPLPPDHPYWAHPCVTVTPHIAAATRAGTASETVARQIARVSRGERPCHIVDRAAGY